MKSDDVLNLASMPLSSPSYPKGLFRFIDREYFIISYETDPKSIRFALPEPLEPDGSNLVLYEFIRMPDSSGFGNYTESGLVIPAIFDGEQVNFVSQMYLDNEPAILGGREIWGFPKKYGKPRLTTINGTLTGVLEYDNIVVAVGTMTYKHRNMLYDYENGCATTNKEILKNLSKTQINLKLIPHVDGTLAIAQLVSFRLTDITIKGAWSGSSRLHLVPHVNAPVADFPVCKIIDGLHLIADLTLPYGNVIHDYLK